MGAYFAFVRILSSVSRHHQTRGRRFPMEHFLESHRIVSSLPSVTELHISDLIELSTKDASVVPAPTAPRIKKMRVDIDWGTILRIWEGFRSYRSMYIQHLKNSMP